MPNAIHDRVIAGVAAEIKALALASALAGTVGDNVYEQTQADTTNVQYPCVVLEPEDESLEDLSSESDMIAYPVKVLIMDRDSKRDPRLKAEYLGWRRRIARKFRSLVTLDGVSECYDVRVSPRAVIDRGNRAYEQVVSALTVTAYTSEPRQVGVEA